jgi:acetyltransferase-like isoleucine patch superfamily enzyme
MGYFYKGPHTYGDIKVLDCGGPYNVYAGKFCSIAEGVEAYLDCDHRPDFISTYPFSQWGLPTPGHPFGKGDITIGNDVWVGRKATLMSGITIGNGAVIGAHSVVTKFVPGYTVVAGSPAKIRKYRFDNNTILWLQELCWWDWPEEIIARAAPILMSSDIEALRRFVRDNFIG